MAGDPSADVHERSLTPSDEVVAPAKVLRLATMVDAIVDELHAQYCDEASRTRIRLMYRDALVEVGSALSDPLLEELGRLQPTLRIESDDELRIDIVLLAGWLKGLRFGLAATETTPKEPTATAGEGQPGA